MSDSSKYDFKIEDASKVFFTSDTHFNHFNIIKSCSRPFKDEVEMNEALIENWNKVADDDSVIFHLGDFAWGGFSKWTPILERLKGHIVLIKGNHDQKNGPKTKEQEDEVFDFVTQQLYLRIEGRPVFLNHFPFLCYGGTYREPQDVVYQLYGHVHSGPVSKEGLDIPRLIHAFPSQYDVGVDNNNYTPVSWYEVDRKIQEQIKNSLENENISNS
jgi:calcineurin-like phosphoesterase family protein